MSRRPLSAAAGAALALGFVLLAVPAAATPAPVTKITFKLDAHLVVAGSDVTGDVHVFTRNGNAWDPLADVTISVSVDGSEVGTEITDTDGYASVAYPAIEGEHVMKVRFAGDDLHMSAQRAQGFQATPAPAPAPTPTVFAPDAPVLTGSAPAPGLAYLEWTTPADGGSPITGYRIYRGDASGEEKLLFSKPAGAWDADDPTGVAGSSYYYVITAVNAVGESVWSNEVAVTIA